MDRTISAELVYEQLSIFARRAREVGSEFHPGLTIVGFTQLSYLEQHPGIRAADIAEMWGLDKSTVSRQVGRLVDDGLVRRAGERPGRRGQSLEITEAGAAVLATAAASVRTVLLQQLAGWSDRDVRAFGALLRRFNAEARDGR